MEGTIGEMRIVAYDWAPRNWAFCNGQMLAIASNTALFSIIGTMYGGDGQSTFQLPDYRGRVPISQGPGPGLRDYRVGQNYGVESVTIDTLTMGMHSHTITQNLTMDELKINCSDDSDNNVASPVNAYPSISEGNMYHFTDDTALGGIIPITIGGSMSLGDTGGNASHTNIQPFIAMHYMICEFGTFPSRN